MLQPFFIQHWSLAVFLAHSPYPVKPALHVWHWNNLCYADKGKTYFKVTLSRLSTSVTVETAVQLMPLLLQVRAGTALWELVQFNNTKPV